MAINLAEQTVHALNRAAAAAAADGAPEIHPEHILAGLFSEADGELQALASRCGLRLDDLPEAMRGAARTYEAHLPFAERSHQVLAAATAESGPLPTTSIQLLAALFSDGGEICRSTLLEWGLDEDALAQEPASAGGAESELGQSSAQ